MQNGFLYEIINILILSGNYLNLVEFFKAVTRRTTPRGASTDTLVRNCNIAIDVFVTIKWFLVIFLWANEISGALWTVLIFYLIWSTLHTYFYYHLWKTGNGTGFERSKRRFISLIQAIGFINVAFGYLYSTAFYNDFIWRSFPGGSKFSLSLAYSFSQSFFIGSDIARPITFIGELLPLTQIGITFIFVVILLAKSLPGEQLADQKGQENGL